MKMLREKLRSRRGFTLVEMLIVVAIIAILVAVSIPLIQSSLERVRDTTDQANERAAKAEAVLVYLGAVEGKTDGYYDSLSEDYFFYDNESGQLLNQEDAKGIKPYGKCTQEHPGEHLFMSVWGADGVYEDEGNHVDKYIMVEIDENGTIRLVWWSLTA